MVLDRLTVYPPNLVSQHILIREDVQILFSMLTCMIGLPITASSIPKEEPNCCEIVTSMRRNRRNWLRHLPHRKSNVTMDLNAQFFGVIRALDGAEFELPHVQ